jgi:hypothetical protein
MQINSLLKKELVFVIIVLFVGTSTATIVEPSNVLITRTKAATRIQHSSRDLIELKYYDPNTLMQDIGIQGGTPPYVWQSAIRLTQNELSRYKTWNITQVVIGFGQDDAEGSMNVTIIIYDKGTSTHPGNIIVNDTWAILTGIALITVPLTTSVSLVGHNEIWVAVQWTQNIDKTHYALIDTGPAVDGKGDWVYLYNTWSELQAVSSIDANWAIGAVVEGINQPPNPPMITGALKGKVGALHNYHFTATDPEGDNVYYFIDWGDTSTSGWLGPYSSGEEINDSHTWNKQGTYTLKAKVKDSFGAESDWATEKITMPLSYELSHLRFLDWLFERFPHAFPILRQLQGY